MNVNNKQTTQTVIEINWETQFHHLKLYIHNEHIEHLKFFNIALEKYKNEDKKLRINRIVENNDILTDQKFQYESALVNYAKMFYAEEQHKYFKLHNQTNTVSLEHDDNNKLNSPSLESNSKDNEQFDQGEAIKDKIWKERYEILMNLLEQLKMEYVKKSDDSIQSIENSKTKLLCTLFTKNNQLLLENKYQYEMLVVQFGFVIFGNIQKHIIEDVESWEILLE